MKYFLLILFYFSGIIAPAQSPYTSILVKMDSAKAGFTQYKIEMKICEVKNSERGAWFRYDSSKINFDTLKATDLKCGDYFDEGLPTIISGQKEKKPINQFEFGNQLFAWQHVFIFKISNMSSRGWHPEMYIVVPVKYKSFRTSINISDIEFQSDKVIFLSNLEQKDEQQVLFLSRSLKDKKGIDLKSFSLKNILK